MSEQSLTIARFARVMEEAFRTLAADLEAAEAVPDTAAAEEVAVPVGRGQRQVQILELKGLGTDGGMKTADVAAAIAYEVPNTYSTLQALERAGVVEMVPGVTPQTWRLAARYRTSAPVFMRLASRVREGEWTTYGDISIAVRGDTKASRGVGRAAATISNFPHPERVLMEGGLVNPSWRDGAGRGPDHCRRLLEEQGVLFVDDHADRSMRVTWDELLRRDKAEPVIE